MKDEIIATDNGRVHAVRCYDNDGKPADSRSAERYTVIYMDVPERYAVKTGRQRPGMGLTAFEALGMNAPPHHGTGTHTTALPGAHLGERIAFAELPEECRECVLSELAGFKGRTRTFLWFISGSERFTAEGAHQQDAFDSLPGAWRARVPFAEFCVELPAGARKTAPYLELLAIKQKTST